jgi:hypothetical protein
VFLAGIASANGQKLEITPLVGARYGGTLNVREDPQSAKTPATLDDSVVFGVAGGFRFGSVYGCDGCDVIEFRWMRQNTHLGLEDGSLVPNPLTATAPFRPSVTLDHFLGDFTHEFEIDESKIIRPFLTATLGAVRMATPAGAATRFVFGFGTGVKVFPKPRWGFRFGVEYLPMVMHAAAQNVVCAGGCIVTVNAGVMNQFEVTGGPIFRF